MPFYYPPAYTFKYQQQQNIDFSTAVAETVIQEISFVPGELSLNDMLRCSWVMYRGGSASVNVATIRLRLNTSSGFILATLANTVGDRFVRGFFDLAFYLNGTVPTIKNTSAANSAAFSVNDGPVGTAFNANADNKLVITGQCPANTAQMRSLFVTKVRGAPA